MPANRPRRRRRSSKRVNRMTQQFVAFGGNEPAGQYLRQTRDECQKSQDELRANVTACILLKFTEFDKALFASWQYVLTLWPALVGAIVALGPEPANMSFDNICPAVLGGVFELLQNRVDLYESVKNEPEAIEQGSSKDEAQTPKTSVVANRSSQLRFRRVKVRSVFSLWLRILVHQWRREKYRILIRDPSTHRFWWLFLCGRALLGIGRITMFALGSITMGNILIMPVPDHVYLFVFAIVYYSVSRYLWPAFCTNGNHGADLVVFVRSIKSIGAAPVKCSNERVWSDLDERILSTMLARIQSTQIYFDRCRSVMVWLNQGVDLITVHRRFI
ncbi:MAG: hypothetical protein Q9217_000438 [Psora testacea]